MPLSKRKTPSIIRFGASMDVLYPHRKFSGNASELAEKAIECATNFGWTVDLDKTNERLVRYYVTEGVIDRPDRQGRDASYNFRHLLQLLTARRMVEHGMSLNVIGRHNTLAPPRVWKRALRGQFQRKPKYWSTALKVRMLHEISRLSSKQPALQHLCRYLMFCMSSNECKTTGWLRLDL